MPPRFVLVQGAPPPQRRFQPLGGGVQGGGRFRPVAGGLAPQPSGPSSLQSGFTASRLGSSLLGLGGRLMAPRFERPPGSQNTPSSGVVSPWVGGSQIAGGLAGLGSGALNLSQGNTAPGALQLASGAGQLASGVGTLAPGLNTMLGGGLTIGGGALGMAGGLAGIGLGLAQGGQAGERAAVQSALSLVPGAGPVAFIGSAVENIVNAALGEGVFGQTKLPFGRGNQFSSADNLASQTSMFRGLQGANMLQGAIQGATDPGLLLTMAAMGRTPEDPQYHTLLAPHGEVQFFHPAYPQPEQFQAVIQAIRQAGDPNLLRQFISGVNIQTGEGGATTLNPLATDLYRRKLVSLLPPEFQANTAGLFAPVPAAPWDWSWTPEGGLSNPAYASIAPPLRPAPPPLQSVYEAQKARIPPPYVPTGQEFDVPTQAYNPIDMEAFAALGRLVNPPAPFNPNPVDPSTAYYGSVG